MGRVRRVAVYPIVPYIVVIILSIVHCVRCGSFSSFMRSRFPLPLSMPWPAFTRHSTETTTTASSGGRGMAGGSTFHTTVLMGL